MKRQQRKLTELPCGTGYGAEIIRYMASAMPPPDDLREHLLNIYVQDGTMWASDGGRVHFVEAFFLEDGAYRVQGKVRDRMLRLHDNRGVSEAIRNRMDLKKMFHFGPNSAPARAFTINNDMDASIEYVRTLLLFRDMYAEKFGRETHLCVRKRIRGLRADVRRWQDEKRTCNVALRRNSWIRRQAKI